MKCEICGKSNAIFTIDGRYLCKGDYEQLGYEVCSDCGSPFPPEMEGFEGGKCIKCCEKKD